MFGLDASGTTTRVALALLAAALGWLVGLGSAWWSERLLAEDGLDPAWRQGPLLRDPLVQAGLALVWGLLTLLAPGPTWQLAAAALLAVPLVQVSVTDLRVRYVYTVVAAAGLAAGLVLSPLIHMADWWWGLAGAAAGLVSFGLLYLIGRAVYRGAEPLAHGDVTIAAMVGAMAGPMVLTALVAGVVFSGLFGLVILALRRSRTATMPYGPGLCLGGLLSLFLTSSA